MPGTKIFGIGFEEGAIPTRANFISIGGYTYLDSGHTGNWGIHFWQGAIGGQWTHFQINVNHAQGLNLTLDEIYVSFWSYGRSAWNDRLIIYLTDGNYLLFDYHANPAVLYLNGTPVVSGINYWTGGWDHFQVRWKVADAGGIMAFKTNGVLDGTFTGDTKPGASSTIDYMYWQGRMEVWGANAYLDDIVLGTGDWLGDIRFEALTPSADVTTQFYKNGISYQTPGTAPTAALGAATGLTGVYSYKVSFVDADGETLCSSASNSVTAANQKIDLSSIPLGATGTTSRKIYRTAAGGATYKLVTTIADNTTTTYTDSLADGSLGANEPTSTPLYDKVNERGPNDSSYAYGQTNGHRALYDNTDWSSFGKNPEIVTHWARIWKNPGNAQQLKLVTKVGANETVSAAKTLTTGAEYHHQAMSTNPAGTAWTASDINSIQTGVEAVI